MSIRRQVTNYGGAGWVGQTVEVHATTRRTLSAVGTNYFANMSAADTMPQEWSGQQAIFGCCRCGKENEMMDVRGGRCLGCGHERCFVCLVAVQSFVERRRIMRAPELEREVGLGDRRRLGWY